METDRQKDLDAAREHIRSAFASLSMARVRIGKHHRLASGICLQAQRDAKRSFDITEQEIRRAKGGGE